MCRRKIQKHSRRSQKKYRQEEGLTDEIQPEQPQPEDNSGIIPESESEMQEEEKQEELQEQTQEQVEEENQETIEIKESGRQVPQEGSRVLLEDKFQDASGWKINQPGAVKIGSGQALIKGAGPNNAMISSGIVAAQNFPDTDRFYCRGRQYKLQCESRV